MSTKPISIAGLVFEVTAPYAEGAILTMPEAKVLNQTRSENIGNNFRKDVQAAIAAGTEDAMNAVKAAIADYDAKYTFSMTATREPADPIANEALKIAKEKLKGLILEKTGLSIKAYLAVEGNQAKYDANIEKLVVQADVLKIAKARVASRSKVAEVDVGSAEL